MRFLIHSITLTPWLPSLRPGGRRGSVPLFAETYAHFPIADDATRARTSWPTGKTSRVIREADGVKRRMGHPASPRHDAGNHRADRR